MKGQRKTEELRNWGRFLMFFCILLFVVDKVFKCSTLCFLFWKSMSCGAQNGELDCLTGFGLKACWKSRLITRWNLVVSGNWRIFALSFEERLHSTKRNPPSQHSTFNTINLTFNIKTKDYGTERNIEIS